MVSKTSRTILSLRALILITFDLNHHLTFLQLVLQHQMRTLILSKKRNHFSQINNHHITANRNSEDLRKILTLLDTHTKLMSKWKRENMLMHSKNLIQLLEKSKNKKKSKKGLNLKTNSVMTMMNLLQKAQESQSLQSQVTLTHTHPTILLTPLLLS